MKRFRLGEIVNRLTHGGTPPTDDPALWTGEIPWITGADILNQRVGDIRRHVNEKAVRTTSTNIVSKGDLLLVTRTGVGKMAIAPFDVAISQDFTGVTFDDQVADTNYMYFLLQAKTDDLLAFNQGTSINGITRSDLLNLEIDLPQKIEQTAIADVLTTVDRAIEQTEALIAKLRRIKAGLVHDLLTRGIDEHGNLRDPSTHEFKQSPLGLIPVEWEVVHLSDILSFPSGQVDPKQLPYSQWPLVAPDHIESRTGRLLKIRTAAEQGAISGKYCFTSGDVVYSKIRPYLRKAILADFEGLCSADMYPLRPTQDVIPVYLLMILLGEGFSRFAEAASERSGFPKINRSEMSEYILALPNVAEQLRCGQVYSTLDNLQHQTFQELAKLQRLKTGLMQDLLTGRVSVEALLGETALQRD